MKKRSMLAVASLAAGVVASLTAPSAAHATTDLNTDRPSPVTAEDLTSFLDIAPATGPDLADGSAGA